MRRILGSICTLALLAPAPAMPQAAQGKQARPASQSGYCRTPGPLPRLAPEQRRDQQQQVGPARSRDYPAMAAPPPPPPPPSARATPMPAPEAGSGEDDYSSVVVTGSRIRGDFEAASPVTVGEASAASEDRRSLPPSTTPPVRRRPQPQSGLLTAGEHDDLLNPELYAEYVRSSGLGQQLRGLPVLDTARLLTVEVRDNRGRQVAFAPVELRCSDGNTITLRTVADGSVVFFPGLDRLSETVRIRASGGEWREVRIAQGAGAQRVGITSAAPAAPVRRLDLALAVDVTGSMGDEIAFLQSELRSILASLSARHPQLDIRIGFVFYRDQGDDFITQTVPFGSDLAAAQRQLAGHRAGGGGDTPEAVQDAMIRAAGLDWRPDAVKTLLLVADAPPHDQDFAASWLAAEHLRAARVHIVPVGASGVEDRAEYLMRAMAAATQSRYTFLTDDSGIGNAHAAPAIDCYLVTRLDQLLRRVIDSQISGRRIEPEEQEVIRRVGQYDAGRCVLPSGFGGNGQGKNR